MHHQVHSFGISAKDVKASGVAHRFFSLNKGRPQEHCINLVQQALKEAGVSPSEIDGIAYTKVSSNQGQQGLPSNMLLHTSKL